MSREAAQNHSAHDSDFAISGCVPAPVIYAQLRHISLPPKPDFNHWSDFSDLENTR